MPTEITEPKVSNGRAHVRASGCTDPDEYVARVKATCCKCSRWCKLNEPKMHQQVVTAGGLSEAARGAAAASEALKTLVSAHPERESENMEPRQAERDERATAGRKDPRKEVVSEASGESTPAETVEAHLLEDETSWFHSEVQVISLAEQTVSPAPETKPGSIETRDGEPSKILAGVGLTPCAGGSSATSSVSSQATVNMAAQVEPITEGSALVAPPQESISSEDTADRASGGSDTAENLTQLALDLLLDPPTEQTQVMEPVGTQEQEEEKPEDNQAPSAPLGAELRVSSPDRAPSEGNTDTDPDGAGEDEEGEEEDAELDGEVRKKSQICPTV